MSVCATPRVGRLLAGAAVVATLALTVLAIAAPREAKAYDWNSVGLVLAGTWDLNGPNDNWDKINGFYGGSGSFRMCVRRSSPGYVDDKDCGYANYAQPQARLVFCFTTIYGRPGLWNGDNNNHNFENRAYYNC